MKDGTIKAGCYHMCNKQFVDLSNFAPMDGSSHTQGDRTKFDAAYVAYQVGHAAGDRDECVAQRGVLESLRVDRCFECRPDKGYLTPAQRARCRRFTWTAVRASFRCRSGWANEQGCRRFAWTATTLTRPSPRSSARRCARTRA